MSKIDKDIIMKSKVYDQIVWERNIAIAQLEELGGSFGEKPELIKARIYNKAIDEFAKAIKPYIAQYRSAIEHNRYAFIDVNNIAEQLKEKNITIDEELEIINDNIDDKLRILEEWKNDVINSLCKYDCHSVEEVAHNAYNQALKDLQKKIDDEYYDGSYGDYHEVKMIVRMIERLKRIEF